MDIHSTFETLAEAWVAASTPTAVNPDAKSTKTSTTTTATTSSSSRGSSMLPKEQHHHQTDKHRIKDSTSSNSDTDIEDDNSHHHQHHHHHHQQHHLQDPHQDLLGSSHHAGSSLLARTDANMSLTPSMMTSLTSSSARGMSGMKAPSPRKSESSSQSGTASMPIRCVVEHVNGPVNFDNAGSGTCEVTAVEQDAFAILPVNTPLCDLVRAALARLGYSASDAVNAKGAIQLKNWKPLSFDVITDDKEATIDDILRELKEYTLRIRLASLPRLSSVEEMKEKLLQLLLTTSFSLLLDNGCPVDKGLLMSLSKGEHFPVAEDMVAQFDKWYNSQIFKSKTSPPSSSSSLPLLPTPTTTTTTEHETSSPIITDPETTKPRVITSTPEKSLSVLSSLSSPSSLQGHMMLNGVGPFTPQNPGMPLTSHGPILTPSKTRIRTSFDPEHEIPRLQRWFQENQHPSREQMVRYMSELNNLDSRRGRRPLDLTNIIYWFKNARAAQRRATKALDDSFENEENVDVTSGASLSSNGGILSDSSSLPPYLPNKNAVYIVPYPYHTTHPSPSHTMMPAPEHTTESNDEPCDLSIKKLKDTTTNLLDQSQASPGLARIKTETGLEVAEAGRTPGHKTPTLPNGFSVKPRNEDSEFKPSAFNGVVHRPDSDCDKDKREEGRGEERAEKHFLNLKDEEQEEERLVMDLKEDRDASSDDSVSSDMETGPVKSQEEEEMDYMAAHARAELGLGMSHLAATSESSAASMAALSLAQMSQPPLQIPINPLAMYYNLPPYYHHPSPSHHSQTSAAATAAMVAALRGSAHMNGHNSHHSTSHSTNSHQPQVGNRPPVPIQPSHHTPLPNSQPHNRSSEPRKRRTRVFIDPLTEIPKLEKWFIEDTHPSAYMIDKYTETLNSAEYRQKFPRLEPKNIQLWFKNHRAKVKRQRMGLGAEECVGDSPPHPGSRSATPVMGREGGSLGSGTMSSPDNASSSKNSDDVVSVTQVCDPIEEGEQ